MPLEIRTTTEEDEHRSTTGGDIRALAGSISTATTYVDGFAGPRERRLFTAPTPELVEAFASGYGRVVAFADIYHSDNETLWRPGVGIREGSVSADMSRDERRVLEITIGQDGQPIEYGPGDEQLWYDKIIKPYRGVTIDDIDYVCPLGEFMIDKVSRPHFPNTFQISARDFTKKLIKSKLAGITTFTTSQQLHEVIASLAINAGIHSSRINVPVSTGTLVADVPFEPGTTRWECIKTLCDAYGFEAFFDNSGVFVMREFVDPLTAPVSHSFTTGASGNLATYTQSSDDSQLHNEVVVYGTGQTNGLVWAKASNTAPGSPTRVARLGPRTMEWPSQVVPDNTTAQSVADQLLAVAALEQFDVQIASLAAPWIQEGTAVEFIPDSYNGYDPTRFLLTSFTIKLGPGPMDANAKRVHIVG